MPKTARQLLVIDVALDHVSPRIWRRVTVRSDSFLPKLHLILQIVMGWENCHLHEFSTESDRFGIPDEDFPEMRLQNEIKVRVSQLLKFPGDTAAYTYDYGDDWSHTLELIEVADWNPSSISPVCIAGERNCPPEDVGGPPGYETYLAALGDPRHEMHNQYIEWRRADFDANEFDINKVNVLLGREFRTDA